MHSFKPYSTQIVFFYFLIGEDYFVSNEPLSFTLGFVKTLDILTYKSFIIKKPTTLVKPRVNDYLDRTFVTTFTEDFRKTESKRLPYLY